MTFRINANSCKNAMGTVFLLAAAFFVCSTFISMRSVFADPIAPANTLPQRSGRTSPRATTATNSRATTARTTARTSTSRAASARASVTPQSASRVAVSRGGGAVRTVNSRGVSSVRGTNTNPVSSRGVVSRNQNNTSARTNTSKRAVRARTATTNPSRVSATGAVMAGNRATLASGSSSYSYLASSLYTGSYSNIIDSSTGLISADAYSNCMESYYTCMDEICTARSDAKGRCSCAGRATNFLEAETLLEQANEELIKLSGQLSLLIATKGKGDDLAAAFSLTDAEKVMNCVSWKDAWLVAGSTTDSKGNKISRNDYLNKWCQEHNLYEYSDTGGSCSFGLKASGPDYCTSGGTSGNNFGFDISNIDGSSSDILAQLKAWADAKDLAKQYTTDDKNDLWGSFTTMAGAINGMSGITTKVDTSKASLDSLANKWGYDLFQYAHNNVCGRVLDSCFNGIYEACGNPKSITEDGVTVRIKCANGATTNCPFNYNSYISVNTETGDVVLSDRSDSSNASVNSSAACFGYSGTATTTTRSGITSTSTDPYATLRGPVADARRSIMQKYLLDANAACDVYGDALKQTAQNINYQKIAAEQALQQKRLEFKQEEQAAIFANASTAIDNFNECISEIWDCYDEYSDEENWTTARIKAYCSQVSQVPHCYEPMICSPLQTQLVAVVDKADSDKCVLSNDYTETTCRNVVTLNEILYGASKDQAVSTVLDNWDATYGKLNGVNSAQVRELCLQRSLGCGANASALGSSETPYCLRRWNKTDKGQVSTSWQTTSISQSDVSSSRSCAQEELPANAIRGLYTDGRCFVTECKADTDLVVNATATACVCPSGLTWSNAVNRCVEAEE